MTFRNAPLKTIVVSAGFKCDTNHFGTNGNYTGGATGTADVYCLSETVGSCTIPDTQNVMIKKIHYYSKEKPTDTEHTYWYYDEQGVPTVWGN